MATKKKRTSSKKKNTKKNEVGYGWSILLFALGIFFIALSFIPGESVWYMIRENFLFGIFGICAWVLGPLLIYYAILIGFGKPLLSAVIKGLFFFLALTGAALVFSNVNLTDQNFIQVVQTLFTTAKNNHFGGGVLSVALGYTLLMLCGKTAARILLGVIVLIVIMAFSGVTPADIVNFIKNKSTTVAKKQKERTRAKKLEEDDVYEYQDDVPDVYFDEYEQQTIYDQNKGNKKPFWKQKKQVDIDLGPGNVISEPGLAENEHVVIGEGGTFGMNPLQEPEKREEDPILPFDPYADVSLVDGAKKDQPNIRLINELGNVPLTTQNGEVSPSFLPKTTLESIPATKGIYDTSHNRQSEQSVLNSNLTNNLSKEIPRTSVGIDDGVNALIDKAAAKKVDVFSVGDSRRLQDEENYAYPPITLFEKITETNANGAKEEMHQNAELLTSTLESFGVKTSILDVTRGPSVTRYEIQPQKGVKISKITNLADDIALNLAAAGVRIEAPIPGKPAVGIEVPNKVKTTVGIRSILESNTFASSTSPVSFALGKDIAGDCVVADLAKMPHLLIAGSTGSGKSVCVNATIMSFLYKSSPEDLKLILIDPKVVELAEYNGIPHLLMPVITEPRKAAGALGAAVAEMERRYHLFAENNVRDIKTFNKLSERVEELEKLPYIAIVIDELADLMMVAGKDVENYICRIAQKARAAGMHLIVATQRPSVDVITGLIKANIPSRIAFAVSSQIDSRTILDGAGAEKLLGMGDMLYMPVGANKPVRVQGTYVKDEEISAVLNYIKQNSTAQYDEGMILQTDKMSAEEGSQEASKGNDTSFMAEPTFVNAVDIALEAGQISTSHLQRRLSLGYARAGRIIDQMEQMGIISGPNGSKPREVLITRQDWLELSMNTAEKNREVPEDF